MRDERVSPTAHRTASVTCMPKTERLRLRVRSGRVSLPVTVPVTWHGTATSIVRRTYNSDDAKSRVYTQHPACLMPMKTERHKNAAVIPLCARYRAHAGVAWNRRNIQVSARENEINKQLQQDAGGHKKKTKNLTSKPAISSEGDSASVDKQVTEAATHLFEQPPQQGVPRPRIARQHLWHAIRCWGIRSVLRSPFPSNNCGLEQTNRRGPS